MITQRAVLTKNACPLWSLFFFLHNSHVWKMKETKGSLRRSDSIENAVISCVYWYSVRKKRGEVKHHVIYNLIKKLFLFPFTFKPCNFNISLFVIEEDGSSSHYQCRALFQPSGHASRVLLSCLGVFFFFFFGLLSARVFSPPHLLPLATESATSLP